MLNDADETLAARLPVGVVRAVAPRLLEEPRGRWKGRAGVVAAPRNVEEVAGVVRACAEARVGIVPWGGGTGLVGGQVMHEGAVPLVLTLERMAAVRAVYREENVIVAEAGATLQAVRDAAVAAGRQFPLALASQGTATIGGVLATNAGGTGVLRWGNARELCLGVEAVLPDGSVMRTLTRLRKDNTGYSIRDLLVGAEGTLGIITAASLRLAPVPAGQGTGFLVVPDPAAALTLLARAQARFAGGVTGFELISGEGLRFLAEVMPEVRLPFDPAPAWLVLMEVGLPAGMDPEAALSGLLEEAVEAGLVEDALLAQSGAQAAAFWAVRESIPDANRRIGAVASHDVSLPLSEVPGFIAEAGAMLGRMAPELRINCFGHLGDGNLHYNLFPPFGGSRSDHAGAAPALSLAVHELVVARGGSFSAEHGIGRAKTADLARWADPARLAAMRAVKAALDPLGIMNPGAVLA
ncbi:FAD-binding protein [Paracoccus sp. S-4012]|uniref:FAD-binding oxidoreductase n=1 Tax=Paracoccus sp. S-4012 TaxID=2665648 RepID=UPI0012B08EAE|nr:FAD-binding oxidoreductase [Paracoccus sp. S-4012]MRX49178.1 FAD-binding protein [Paracoccus sp. S-4012]